MARELFYADAIKEALAQEMTLDERVYMYGEDLGTYGGVFGVSHDEGAPTFSAPHRLSHLNFVIGVFAAWTPPIVAAGDQVNR